MQRCQQRRRACWVFDQCWSPPPPAVVAARWGCVQPRLKPPTGCRMGYPAVGFMSRVSLAVAGRSIWSHKGRHSSLLHVPFLPLQLICTNYYSATAGCSMLTTCTHHRCHQCADGQRDKTAAAAGALLGPVALSELLQVLQTEVRQGHRVDTWCDIMMTGPPWAIVTVSTRRLVITTDIA